MTSPFDEPTRRYRQSHAVDGQHPPTQDPTRRYPQPWERSPRDPQTWEPTRRYPQAVNPFEAPTVVREHTGDAAEEPGSWSLPLPLVRVRRRTSRWLEELPPESRAVLEAARHGQTSSRARVAHALRASRPRPFAHEE
jgi:hypothetical protein